MEKAKENKTLRESIIQVDFVATENYNIHVILPIKNYLGPSEVGQQVKVLAMDSSDLRLILRTHEEEKNQPQIVL